MAKRKKTVRKDAMHKNQGWKYFMWPCLLVIIFSCVFLIYWINNRNSTYNNIEYIKGFMTSQGKLNDFSNKLGMHDPNTDIKWFMTDKEVRIEFGRIILDWEKEEFFDQANLDHLSTIGITTEIKEDEKTHVKVLHVYYCGMELERWIK